jgi:transposase-like protein
MPGKRISEKKKRNVVRAYERGSPKKKIAEQFGISPSSVDRIVRKRILKDSHERKLIPDVKTERQKRIEDLERRVAELEKKIIEFEAKKKSKRSIF